jgi:uncharacterized protein YdhG (YjbR/CyaY superfamily)
MNKGSRAVDAYIAAAPREARKKLETVRSAIRDVAPEAQESISYRIPYYSHKGRLVWFGLQKKHIGLYLRPPVIEEHKKELSGYVTTKSAVHFPLDEQIPVPLVRLLVRARMRINEAEEEGKGGGVARVSRRASGLQWPAGRASDIRSKT